MSSWNWEKLKTVNKEFLKLHVRRRNFQYQHMRLGENKYICFYFIIYFLCIYVTYGEFDNGLFTNLPRIIVTRDFSSSLFNLKEVPYLHWQNKSCNLKTTCHINPKFFLWTKLLENLLLVKYLISCWNSDL